MLICSWSWLSEVGGEGGVSLSDGLTGSLVWCSSLLLFFFVGSEESRWSMPCCGHKTGQSLFLCLWVWVLQNYSLDTNRLLRPDGMSGSQERWSGMVSVLVPLCQVSTVRARGKPLMTAWWLAVSRALVWVSSSTLSPPLFPSCLAVCEKYVPCGLVGAVKWWLSVWLLIEAGERGAGEERLVLSNCVYGSNTIISPCDCLIE